MKKIFLIIICVIPILFASTISYSSEKVIFIDFDYIINTSDRGSSIFKDLNQKREENINILKSDEKKIKEQKNNLKLKKDIISKDEFDKNLKSLNISINNFQKKKKLMEDDLAKIRNEKISIFIEKINKLLEKYMNEQSVDIMLNGKNILIGKKNINKTEDVLKLINDNIK